MRATRANNCRIAQPLQRPAAQDMEALESTQLMPKYTDTLPTSVRQQTLGSELKGSLYLVQLEYGLYTISNLEFRKECRNRLRIMLILFPEFGARLLFFGSGQPHVHVNQNWKHRQGDDSRPLQQESEHDHHEPGILRMPDFCVRSGCGQGMPSLRPVQHLPRIGQQEEPCNDQDIAQQVKRAEMRIAAPAEQLFQQVPGIMRERIDARNAIGEPSRQQVDGERKTVH